MNSHDIEPLRQLMGAAPYGASLGLAFESAGAGRCGRPLGGRPAERRQTGLVHAGVLTPGADHCAGARHLDAGSRTFAADDRHRLGVAASGRGVSAAPRRRGGQARATAAFMNAEIVAVGDAQPVLLAKAMISFTIVARTAG